MNSRQAHQYSAPAASDWTARDPRDGARRSVAAQRSTVANDPVYSTELHQVYVGDTGVDLRLEDLVASVDIFWH